MIFEQCYPHISPKEKQSCFSCVVSSLVVFDNHSFGHDFVVAVYFV
jgi:hypothetical protein